MSDAVALLDRQAGDGRKGRAAVWKRSWAGRPSTATPSTILRAIPAQGIAAREPSPEITPPYDRVPGALAPAGAGGSAPNRSSALI